MGEVQLDPWIRGVVEDVRRRSGRPFAIRTRGDLVMLGPPEPGGRDDAGASHDAGAGVTGRLHVDLQRDGRRTAALLHDGESFIGELSLRTDESEELASLIAAALEGRAVVESSWFWRVSRPVAVHWHDVGPDASCGYPMTFVFGRGPWGDRRTLRQLTAYPVGRIVDLTRTRNGR